MSKECGKCNTSKDLNQFNKNALSPDGLSYWCKECQSNYNKERYRNGNVGIKISSYAANRLFNKHKRNSIREQYIDEFGGECNRCGYSEFYSALQFHHVIPENKLYETSELIQKYSVIMNYYTKLILEEELEKCIVLCSNCHDGLHSGNWNIEDIELHGYTRTIDLSNLLCG